MPEKHPIRHRAAALGAVATLAAATAACGVGPANDQDRIARTTGTYLHALADRDIANACAQLSRRAQGRHCAQEIKQRLSQLDHQTLEDAADASLSISVHGATATATLATPHGARLTLVKTGGGWRIAAGYTVDSAAANARTPHSAPAIVGPGRLVPIGAGRRLYLRCVGAGRPTVILEGGFGADSQTWQDVQPQLGHTMRVCAYDRAGLGNSVALPGVHDADDEVRDLQRLLHAAHIQPPYVLAGHSYGGLLVRLFAHEHPRETAGVVLIDAMGRAQRRRELAAWPTAHAPTQRNQLARPVHNGVDFAAGDHLSNRVRTLGNTPLAVITAGTHAQEFASLPPRVARALSQLWTTMQDELAALSRHSIHVIALRSDHFIQRLDGQPSVVIRAISAVQHAARRHATLPTCPHLFTGPDVRCRQARQAQPA
jgi:pimeloyl-ACP methyl ester carboxylesterase